MYRYIYTAISILLIPYIYLCLLSISISRVNPTGSTRPYRREDQYLCIEIQPAPPLPTHAPNISKGAPLRLPKPLADQFGLTRGNSRVNPISGLTRG